MVIQSSSDKDDSSSATSGDDATKGGEKESCNKTNNNSGDDDDTEMINNVNRKINYSEHADSNTDNKESDESPKKPVAEANNFGEQVGQDNQTGLEDGKQSAEEANPEEEVSDEIENDGDVKQHNESGLEEDSKQPAYEPSSEEEASDENESDGDISTGGKKGEKRKREERTPYEMGFHPRSRAGGGDTSTDFRSRVLLQITLTVLISDIR